MKTEIISNGSGSVQPLETLFARLEQEPLDRKFEAYGNFFYASASEKGFGKRQKGFDGTPFTHPARELHFFGNFLHTSHVFNLRTTDTDLMIRLSKAIRANQKRPDYLIQTKPKPLPYREN